MWTELFLNHLRGHIDFNVFRNLSKLDAIFIRRACRLLFKNVGNMSFDAFGVERMATLVKSDFVFVWVNYWSIKVVIFAFFFTPSHCSSPLLRSTGIFRFVFDNFIQELLALLASDFPKQYPRTLFDSGQGYRLKLIVSSALICIFKNLAFSYRFSIYIEYHIL